MFQKILKRQSFQDDFEQKTREFEQSIKKRDIEFDKKVQEVKDIKVTINQRYFQMKADRDDNLKRMDIMENEIKSYRDKFSL